MKTIESNKLPDRPGDLIRLAIGDLALVEADPNYRVNMWTWHAPRLGEPCNVCLAGSVMAKTLDCAPTKSTDPWSFPGGVAAKLNALNYFRTGEVTAGLREMGMEPLVQDMRITHHALNPTAFRRDMLAMADTLDEAFPEESHNG